MLISEITNILKSVSIFAKTDESILAKIAKYLKEVTIKANQTIFYKGDKGRDMYIILSGSVKVHDGLHTFATLGKKQVFGEYALLDTEVRSASVTALEDTQLLVLEQKVFYGVMVNNIEIVQGILQILVERSRQNNKLQEELAREKKTIEEQSQQIKLAYEEIRSQNEEILTQQNYIEQQNKELVEKNDFVTSSLQYAETIQTALLPKAEKIHTFLPKSFVFYKAKDIVSGDFYWISEVDQKIVLAAVDCTGHGVPGAFMSCLGISYLDQIVDFQRITEPNLILSQLHKRISTALDQEHGNTQDGMDLSVCVIDKKHNILEYASARSHLFYIQDEQLKVIKGDNYPIGGSNYNTKRDRHFTKHRIKLHTPTQFYIFSDGYRDQFGGEEDKKFMMSRFKELLFDIHQKSSKDQYQLLSQTYQNWKGKQEQTDDIVVIGFKL